MDRIVIAAKIPIIIEIVNFVLMSDEMKCKVIDLNDWERSGGGGNGWSYVNKYDDSLLLKLNKETVPEEMSYREFRISDALYRMGIQCPRVYDFVSDGTRFGMTVERLPQKKSYARMIADDPDSLEQLARDFARRSREFHSIECDITGLESKSVRCRRLFEACAALPEDIKKMLYGCLDSLDDVRFPVHGDFSPGNIVRSGGKDYWIDLGDFCYGDPDMDMGSLVFISRYVPAKVLEYLFHISRKQFRQFVETYGQEYYGEKWHSMELEEKIHNLVMIRAALSVANNPRSSVIYLPLLRGQNLRFGIILKIADLLIRQFN